MRASDRHRLRVAQNLIERFWLETRADDPLPESATSVFSRAPGSAGPAEPGGRPALRGGR